jgi:hypothetical protein
LQIALPPALALAMVMAMTLVMAMVMALFANKKVFSSVPIKNYNKILPHKKIIYLNTFK